MEETKTNKFVNYIKKKVKEAGPLNIILDTIIICLLIVLIILVIRAFI